MSVPNQTPYIIYNANGLTTVFPFEFYIINSGDIQVSLNGDVLTTGYSVSGVGNVGGGDVTFLTPPANGSVVMLERVVPTYRLTDYQDNGDLLADTVNKDFDRLWMAIQRSFTYLGLALRRPLFGGPYNAEGFRIANLDNPVNPQDAATKNYVDNVSLARALRVPESYVDVLPPADQRANKLLAFNSAGKPIVVLPPSGSATDVLIELAKPTGAGIIGAEDKNGAPTTVQDELDNINKTLYEASSPAAFDYTKLTVLRHNYAYGENGDAIEAQTGIPKGNLFPQGIAVDDVTGEIFIIRTNYVSTGTPAWVDIYDSNFSHLKTISIGQDYPEGMIIGYVAGQRRIGIGMSTGYAVYIIPETSAIQDMSTLTPLFTQLSSNQGVQMNSFGDYCIIINNSASTSTQSSNGLYSVYKTSEFLTTADPVRISFFSSPSYICGSAFGSSSGTQSKAQSVAITPYDITIVGGQIWIQSQSTSEKAKPSRRIRISSLSYNGVPKAGCIMDPGSFIKILNDAGYMSSSGSAIDSIEPEAVTFSTVHGLLFYFYVAGMDLVLKVGGAISGKDNFDFSRCVMPQDFSPGHLSRADQLLPINTITGTVLSTADEVFDFMKSQGLRELTCNTKGTTFKIGTIATFANSNTFLRFINSNDSASRIDVWDFYNSAEVQSIYYASGNTPRGFVKCNTRIGGTAENTAGIQISPNNWTTIRLGVPGSQSNTPLAFFNETNGVVGQVTHTATTTTYSTTSDVRLKNIKGDVENGLDKIIELVENGGVKSASFKSDDENVMPMFMAQVVKDVIPEMVISGTDDINPGEEGFMPYTVDKSAITPYLVAAIYKLYQELKK